MQEQGLRNDSVEFYVELCSYVELYAEEELEHRVGPFFDDLVVHLVQSYEAGSVANSVDGDMRCR